MRPEFLRRFSLLVCAALAVVGLAQAAAAQTKARSIFVQRVDTRADDAPADGAPSFKVRTSFTLLDGDEVLKPDAIEGVQIKAGNEITGAVPVPTQAQWSVVLLLDTSAVIGRDAGRFKLARDSIVAWFGGAAEESKFVLREYNERVPSPADIFSSNKDELSKKLASFNTSSSSKSCLNFALEESVKKLKDTSNHKAIIVFTATPDTCADGKTTQKIVDQAKADGVQIYAVGLDGYAVDQTYLEGYTKPTGGLAVMQGNPANLQFSLNKVSSLLNSQMDAEFTLFPKKGTQKAQMTVLLKDGTSVQTVFEITPPHDYAGVPQINILGGVQSSADGARFDIGLSAPTEIGKGRLKVIEKQSNQVVLDQFLPTLKPVVFIPLSALTEGHSYFAVIETYDKNNNEVFKSQSAEFLFSPEVISVGIAKIDSPTIDEPYFVVSPTLSSRIGVSLIKAFLETEQSNTLVAGAEDAQELDKPLRIPVKGLAAGPYLVRVVALDGAGKVLGVMPNAPKVVYTEFGFFERVTDWLRKTPLAAPALLGVVVVGILGVFMLILLIRVRSRPRVKSVEISLPNSDRRSPPRAAPFEAPPIPKAKSAPPAVAPVAKKEPEPVAPVAPKAVSVTPAKQPQAKLILQSPASAKYSVEITKTRFTIGRKPDNDAALPVDGTSGVSGLHAQITRRDGAWFLTDAGSSNGTSLDGHKLAKGEARELKAGAIIGLGPKVRLLFQESA